MDGRGVVAHRLVHLGRLLGVQRPQLCPSSPRKARSDLALGLCPELLEDGAGVAHDRHVDLAIVPELAGIDVDVDHLEVGGEARRPPELDHPVEPRADGEDDIGLGERLLRALRKDSA